MRHLRWRFKNTDRACARSSYGVANLCTFMRVTALYNTLAKPTDEQSPMRASTPNQHGSAISSPSTLGMYRPRWPSLAASHVSIHAYPKKEAPCFRPANALPHDSRAAPTSNSSLRSLRGSRANAAPLFSGTHAENAAQLRRLDTNS